VTAGSTGVREVSMPQPTYEIRLRGVLPPELMPCLPGASCSEAGGETVLLTPELDQRSLHQFVRALRDLGIELLGVTSGADVEVFPPKPGRDPSHHDSEDRAAAWELRINGLLGPVLLGALPHDAVSLEPKHTFVVTSGQDGANLLDILQVLVDGGAEVDAVHQTTARNEPQPR
jgi:hypothetical protein